MSSLHTPLPTPGRKCTPWGGKGLKKVDFVTDFYKICRTLRLKMFFAVKGQNQDNISTIPMKLKKKSKFDHNMNEEL